MRFPDQVKVSIKNIFNSGRVLSVLCTRIPRATIPTSGIKVSAGVINARFAKPLDEKLILAWAQRTRVVVTVEEGCLAGGFGSAVLEALAVHQLTTPVRCLGIPDRFIEHGPRRSVIVVAVSSIARFSRW